MKIDAKLLRAVTPMIILLYLSKRAMCGHELFNELKCKAGGDLVISEVALYQVLYALERDRLLAAETNETEKRKKRTYALTDSGKEHLANLRQQVKVLNAALKDIGL